MVFDYSELQTTATDLITEFGRAITLRHKTLTAIATIGVFLDAEGNVSTPGASRRRRGGTTTIEQQGKFLVGDVGVELDETWYVDDEGKRVDIVRCQRLRPATVTLLNTLYVAA